MKYLGFMIDTTGLHLTDDKVKAITNAPAHTNVAELWVWIGLYIFYSKFLPDQATLLAPLYALLHNDTTWRWSELESNSFEEAKQVCCLIVSYTHN